MAEHARALPSKRESLFSVRFDASEEYRVKAQTGRRPICGRLFCAKKSNDGVAKSIALQGAANFSKLIVSAPCLGLGACSETKSLSGSTAAAFACPHPFSYADHSSSSRIPAISCPQDTPHLSNTSFIRRRSSLESTKHPALHA